MQNVRFRPKADITNRTVAIDPVGILMYVARFVLNPVLFTVAALVLVFSRPRWHGPWWLLGGALLSLAAVGVRLIGWPSRDASSTMWLAYEASESLGFVLVGGSAFGRSARPNPMTAIDPTRTLARCTVQRFLTAKQGFKR